MNKLADGASFMFPGVRPISSQQLINHKRDRDGGTLVSLNADLHTCLQHVALA